MISQHMEAVVKWSCIPQLMRTLTSQGILMQAWNIQLWLIISICIAPYQLDQQGYLLEKSIKADLYGFDSNKSLNSKFFKTPMLLR